MQGFSSVGMRRWSTNVFRLLSIVQFAACNYSPNLSEECVNKAPGVSGCSELQSSNFDCCLDTNSLS